MSATEGHGSLLVWRRMYVLAVAHWWRFYNLCQTGPGWCWNSHKYRQNMKSNQLTRQLTCNTLTSVVGCLLWFVSGWFKRYVKVKFEKHLTCLTASHWLGDWRTLRHLSRKILYRKKWRKKINQGEPADLGHLEKGYDAIKREVI